MCAGAFKKARNLEESRAFWRFRAQRFCTPIDSLRPAAPVEPTSRCSAPSTIGGPKRTALSPDAWRKDTGPSRPRSKSSPWSPRLLRNTRCRSRIWDRRATSARHAAANPSKPRPHVHGLASQVDLHARCELEHQATPSANRTRRSASASTSASSSGRWRRSAG